MMTSDDLAFLSAFEECTLGKACWSHDAHVRMAWLKLERHGSLEGALVAIREGIQRYNDSLGGTGYHETVTTAFTHVIAYRRLLASERDQTWQSFQAAHPDLFEKTSPVLERYYSRERLFSDLAKHQFLEPDRARLPVVGTLRLATAADAPTITAIYAPYVEHTVISFETTPPTTAEMAERIRETTTYAPWLVMEVDGVIAGYAYACHHRTRAAYQWAVDVSVYVAEPYQRSGTARALYATLFRLLAEQGYYTAFAGITLPNAASVGLHEAMGFQLVGVYRDVGHKLGSWHDVGWWQRVLAPADKAPGPIKPVDKSSLTL